MIGHARSTCTSLQNHVGRWRRHLQDSYWEPARRNRAGRRYIVVPAVAHIRAFLFLQTRQAIASEYGYYGFSPIVRASNGHRYTRRSAHGISDIVDGLGWIPSVENDLQRFSTASTLPHPWPTAGGSFLSQRVLSRRNTSRAIYA